VEKKVSIIVPCYNMEKYIIRFLDSVIAQKYSNIELIMVNDGSTDNTESIIIDYKNRLEHVGVELVYIIQKNKGVAASINAGLAIFTGDYLTWCDPDDFFMPGSIERKVQFLEANPQYGLVRTDCHIFNEENSTTSVGLMSGKHPVRFKEDLFEDIIRKNNIYITSGCYMVRASAFLNVIPNRQIYASRRGQNYQMLLPITYKYRCAYIDEPLYGCLIRANSHSRSANSLKKKVIQCDDTEDILRNVISSMNIDKEYYYRVITERFLHNKLRIAGTYRDKVLAEECFSKLKNMGSITHRDIKSYLISRNLFINVTVRGLSKVRHVIFGWLK
jgi:glycosyltransferase involved in cell wall biosynthesis